MNRFSQFARFRGKSGKAKNRKKPGEMNKTEAQAAQYLTLLKQEGKILDFWFEAVTFKLADDVRYTPDFKIQYPSGEIRYCDVKAARRVKDRETKAWTGAYRPFEEDDAKAKIRVAARLHPEEFFLLYLDRETGQWTEKLITSETNEAISEIQELVAQ